MATEVRVGDTVNYQLAEGNVVTAKVTAITDQDDIQVEYFHHDQTALKTVDASAARATTFPASVGEFWKMA